MVNNPPESDSISNMVKTILSLAKMDGFKIDKFKYYSDTTEQKALLLVKIPEISNVDREGRETFLSIVDKFSYSGKWQGKERFIGIFDNNGLVVFKTPFFQEMVKEFLIQNF